MALKVLESFIHGFLLFLAKSVTLYSSSIASVIFPKGIQEFLCLFGAYLEPLSAGFSFIAQFFQVSMEIAIAKSVRVVVKDCGLLPLEFFFCL